jgi:hypothetical protein
VNIHKTTFLRYTWKHLPKCSKNVMNFPNYSIRFSFILDLCSVVVAIFNFPYVTILDLCCVVVAIFNFPYVTILDLCSVVMAIFNFLYVTILDLCSVVVTQM